ncbi:MAG TPA: hypothetical protein VFW23_06055 [Tepidisphaeraceae bacterium]|nr:hypothetical protein [Tepidisphaeraceae bacterium]
MSDAAAFRATYSDWRLIKGRKVVQVVFEIPIEQANLAYQVLDGMPNPAAEVWCAVARLKSDTERKVMPVAAANGDPSPTRIDTSPTSGPDIQARARKPVDPEKRLAQLAAIRCSEPMFWRYLNEHGPLGIGAIIDKDTAAAAVRFICQVESRSEIKPNTEAALRWNLLESAFVCWRDVPEYADAS